MIHKNTKPLNNFSLFNLLVLLFILLSLFAIVNGTNYVSEACSVTRYQGLCIKTLASYSNKAKRSPSRWARAGVSVTISEVKLVAQYLDITRKHGYIQGARSRGALADCVECIQDALDDLHKSLGVLRRLSSSGVFKEEMGDVLTWLSASLTNQDTCINGFEGVPRGRRIKQVNGLCDKVQNASYITSNALALVNKLANTGLLLQDLSDDP